MTIDASLAEKQIAAAKAVLEKAFDEYSGTVHVELGILPAGWIVSGTATPAYGLAAPPDPERKDVTGKARAALQAAGYHLA